MTLISLSASKMLAIDKCLAASETLAIFVKLTILFSNSLKSIYYASEMIRSWQYEETCSGFYGSFLVFFAGARSLPLTCP